MFAPFCFHLIIVELLQYLATWKARSFNSGIIQVRVYKKNVLQMYIKTGGWVYDGQKIVGLGKKKTHDRQITCHNELFSYHLIKK